jgi:hypothetical protein
MTIFLSIIYLLVEIVLWFMSPSSTWGLPHVVPYDIVLEQDTNVEILDRVLSTLFMEPFS